MSNLNELDKNLLEQISGFHEIPKASLNIRKNGEVIARNSNSDVQIIPKKDKKGIDIIISPNVKNKSVHIPVIVTVGNFNDVVYNDFYVGENSDVLIVAGCGIHNDANEKSEHDGIHSFHLSKNSKIKYVEKHLGVGNNSSEKVLNPTTNIELGENSYLEMETIQLGGVTYSDRQTKAILNDGAKLVIREKILTTENQIAKTNFEVELIGKNSSVEVISRSVAKDKSKQSFVSRVIGKSVCFGHVECDGILLGNAVIESSPKVVAKDVNASLVHEAAIGKIAGEQILKLQTLGLTEEEAEAEIIKGFLK